MKKLYRSKKYRAIAGVCGGLGEYFDIDPIIFRMIFIALLVNGGAGIIIYILMWIFVPAKT
ncbi:PspC domain-containing protein [candidate division WOR-3 bacterium]|nr:PspC domain-containing protein [candidate division WOR-3 bacterium]